MSNRITLFKNALRKTSFPVMIVTTGTQLTPTNQRLQGATVSSLTSLSMNPIPLLQFNLSVPSTTSQLLRKTGLFAVHILHGDQTCMSLAKRFSQGIKTKLTTPFDTLDIDKDYTIYSQQDNSGMGKLPILKGVKDVLICETKSVMTVQDHDIWVGQVVDSLGHDNDDLDRKLNNHTTGGGLLHHNGHFHRLGGPIDE